MTEPAQTVPNVAARKEDFIVPPVQSTKKLDVLFQQPRVKDTVETTETN
jgi:hypothetical protein